ncbi:DUF2142 domain-containing protein [Streptococcaceae bacterium ESL0729]|nr:DUF2142 domain-containing protein [Streptococcaceae bacterium ESL0729]
MKNVRKDYLILILIFGFLSVLIMPAGTPPDEGHHFYIINRVIDKDWTWVGNGQSRPDGGQWPGTAEIREQIANHTYYDEYFREKLPASQLEYDFNFHLKDIVYLPQIIGVALAKAFFPSYGMMFFFGRLFNLLTYALGICFCLKYAVYGKRVMFFVALLPIMVQQASSLSYDVFTILAIFNFFTLLTRLSVQRKTVTKKEIIWLICSILLLYVTKRNNILLLGLLAFLPTQLLRSKKIGGLIDKIFNFIENRKFVTFISAGFLALVGAYVFLRAKGGFMHFVQVMYNSFFRADINSTLNGIMDNGVIGFFSDFTYQLPGWMITFDFMLLALLLFAERAEDGLVEKRFGLASGMVYPLQMLIIVTGMYFEWTSVVSPDALFSQGAQGRYFTPFLVFFVPFAVYMSKYIKVKIQDKFLDQLLLYTSTINLFTFLILTIQVEWMPNKGADFLLHFF